MMKTEPPKYKRWALLGAGLSLLLPFSIKLYSDFAPRYSHSSNPISPKNISNTETSVSYQWSYVSEASYQASSGSEMNVYCKALGQWIQREASSDLMVESFRCNDQELAIDKLYRFDPRLLLKLDPKKISQASPINALALALSRELEMGRPSLEAAEWSYLEPRLEAAIDRSVRAEAIEGSESLLWTKTYKGKIPSRPEVSHQLEAESSGRSFRAIDPFLALEDIHMKEIETLEMGGKKVSKSTVGIEMRRSSRVTIAIRDAEALPLALSNDPEIERRQILSEWNSFLKDPPVTKASADPLYVRLKLAFRHDPSFASEFRHTLERYSPQSEEFKLLLGALAYAGTDQATQILVESAQAKAKDLDWQRAIAPVLGLSPKPTEASWDYLNEIRQESEDRDLRKGAELALAGHLKQGMQSEKADAFTKEILSRDENSEDIYSMLDLIGNAALTSETPRLQKWANRDDPKLRYSVAESMRLMNSLESEELLLQLLKDPVIEVRRSAGQAFQTRNVSAHALPELLAALSKNDDELLQLSLLETLYRNADLDSGLADKLKTARQNLKLSSSLAERWIEIEAAMGRS